MFAGMSNFAGNVTSRAVLTDESRSPRGVYKRRKTKEKHNNKIAMRKNWILKIALSALVALGATGSATAQKSYEVPALDPEYQALADQVIDLQISEPDKANSTFMKLMRKVKTKKEDLLSLGDYFLEKNVYPCAMQCAKQIYTTDPTYIPGLMFSGEVCMIRKAYGEAGQKFDEVLSIDPNYVPALKRNAFVYKNVNPHVAIEMLQRIQEVEPNNMTTYRDLGDIYYNLEEYKEAIKSYDTYFTAVTTNDSTDIRPAENYMMSLYSDMQFPTIAEKVDRFAALDPNDMIFKRMKFFSAVENVNTAQAQEAMAYITEKQYADSLYLYLDYFYAANFMADQSEAEDATAQAVNYMKLALEKDPTKVPGYKTLATYYRRNRQYDEGIETYKTYMEKLGDKKQLTDVFGLGQQYFTASRQKGITEEKKTEYVQAGIAAFQEVLKEEPGYYKAQMMIARLSITDGTKPEENVKNLYEQALTMMEGKDGTESGKLEAYSYLAFYYVQTDNNDEARKYCDEILKIDPEHTTGVQIDKYLKSVGK